MDKESFILQTTRAGRLPTNAVFTEEKPARLEAERALASGQFERVRLTHLLGSDKKVLIDVDVSAEAKKAPVAATPDAPKKPVTNAATLIGRTSMLVTVSLIIAVVFYVLRRFLL
jgi:hypothetical protein